MHAKIKYTELYLILSLMYVEKNSPVSAEY